MNNKNEKTIQFKITLDNSNPKIWRRILISKDATFFDLHIAIQDAMGWNDSHLHGFSVYLKDRNISLIIIKFPNPESDDDFPERDVRDERAEKISDYFGVSIKQCKYEYDFGDGWVHTIFFEKELPLEASAKYPQCLAGKNACPPEDCGGVWGYEDKLKILKNPKHPEYKDIIEWLNIDNPSEFNPAEFDSRKIEFTDVKEALKEHESRFGVSNNNTTTCEQNLDDGDLSQNLAEDIALLKQKKIPRMGRWEVAQRADPISEMIYGKDSALILTLIAHEESYFILGTRVFPQDGVDNGVKTLLEAIHKNSMLPETVLVKDKKLFNELELIANELNFKVVHVKKLKASPIILRDMIRILKKPR